MVSARAREYYYGGRATTDCYLLVHDATLDIPANMSHLEAPDPQGLPEVDDGGKDNDHHSVKNDVAQSEREQVEAVKERTVG